jgi:hypothetical protein
MLAECLLKTESGHLTDLGVDGRVIRKDVD